MYCWNVISDIQKGREKCFFENYKKYAGDFIFLSEDAKLRELLNVMPKCKTEDQAKAAHLQNPPPHTKRVAIAVVFCYVWGCIVLYINVP